MSSGQTPCKWCTGHPGPESACGVCRNLLRLQDYLRSGRCPAGLGDFAARSIREVHLACLEEADRLIEANPPEVTSHPSTTPKAPPPLASGGLGPKEGERLGAADSVKGGGGEFEEVKVEEPASPDEKAPRASRSRRRRRTRSDRSSRRAHHHTSRDRGRGRSHRGAPVEEAGEKHTEKRSRPSPTPVSEVAEEEEESPVEARGSGRSRERVGPRVPSYSPDRRRERAPVSPPRGPRSHGGKWRGPIPAWPRGRTAPQGNRRGPKKNKGVKHRERGKQFQERGYWGRRK